MRSASAAQLRRSPLATLLASCSYAAPSRNAVIVMWKYARFVPCASLRCHARRASSLLASGASQPSRTCASKSSSRAPTRWWTSCKNNMLMTSIECREPVSGRERGAQCGERFFGERAHLVVGPVLYRVGYEHARRVGAERSCLCVGGGLELSGCDEHHGN